MTLSSVTVAPSVRFGYGCGKSGIAQSIASFKASGHAVDEFKDTNAGALGAKKCQTGTIEQELTALWARSTATREQLLQDLQDWIARAEKSGIRQLEDFSLRLRRYAV